MKDNPMLFAEFTTHTGLRLRARPLLPTDAPYLVQIFEQMSADSRYMRFNQSLENLSEERKWEEAERIAQTTKQRSGGLIVFADLAGMPNTAVAAARYVCVEEGTAEVAISVIDAMQKQGIGNWLMKRLIEVARRDGVRLLTADIRNDNEGIWKILYRLPYEIVRMRDGSFSQVIVDLTRPKLHPPEEAHRIEETAVA